MFSPHRDVCWEQRGGDPPKQRRRRSQGQNLLPIGVWSGSFRAPCCPIFLSPPPEVPALCSPSAASSPPPTDLCPHYPTSLCPGSATHPVLVGVDRGIANRPSKPGHIPRLQRENSTRNLTAALTLASCQPCLPSLPPPVLTLTASLCRCPPRRPGQEQT